jgi:predicted DNA-binding transcriptional regulator AlpA
VFVLDEVAKAARISRRTLERIRARKEGPRTILLTSTLIGVTESDLVEWLRNRPVAEPGLRPKLPTVRRPRPWRKKKRPAADEASRAQRVTTTTVDETAEDNSEPTSLASWKAENARAG